jgi:hypothetical protein
MFDNRFISQPFELTLSQFANPVKQVKEQTPALHVVVAFVRGGQTNPHPPQLVVVVRLVSHPFAVFPSQFAKPVLHAAIKQSPFEHCIVAFGAVQTTPQFPQLFTVKFIFVSQPLAVIPSQFLKPEIHDTIEQTPATHAEFAFGSEHEFPQVPQFAKLVFRLTSHPSALLPLQLAKPLLQLIEQTPEIHTEEAFGGLGQTFPQVPQLLTLVSKLISQPSVAILLQFANPVVQTNPHNPDVQVTLELGRIGQTLPQVPQLLISVSVGAPLSINPSQLSSIVLQISIPTGLMLARLSLQSALLRTYPAG